MTNKKIAVITIVCICIIALVSFIIWKNLTKNEQETDGNIKIVSSFYPIYIMTENITEGAEDIELVNMADVNVGCLHDYTLTTEDMKKVEDADVFVQNGLGMESFIDKIISSNNNLTLIDSSEGIENIIQHEDKTNAHIWTNIDNYIKQVENISNGLQQADAANAEIYKNNTNEYIQKLQGLKERYTSELASLEGTKVINLNEAFEYLGQELKMDMTTIVTDHEESTMSAEMLGNIISQVEQENIEMIIVDKNDNKSNAETIANETGAKIYELNSGLTGDLDRDAFVRAMEENLNVLLER